jgi:hypothetical protein
MFDNRTPEQLRAELAAFTNTPESVPQTPQAPGASPEELRVAYILRKKAADISPSERAEIAAEIAYWQAHRNDA